MNKKKVITVIVIVLLITAGIVAFLVIRRRKENPNTKKESLPSQVVNAVSSAISGYVAESFPLRVGMKGNNVKIMQDSLAYLGYRHPTQEFVVDGYFGEITLNLVRQYFKNPLKNEVTEAEWKPFYTIYSVNRNLPIIK
jgi:hypothetical protein